MITKKAIEIARDTHNEEIEVEDKLTAIQDIVELDKVPKRRPGGNASMAD